MGAPEEADIGKIEPGALLRVKWRGKVCWVVRRTEETLKNLKENTGHLADPDSEVPSSPNTARTITVPSSRNT